MKEIIKIQKKYLVFRNETRDLEKQILGKIAKDKKKSEIFLDFEGVEFFSRGFGDELLNLIDSFKIKNVKIRIINLKTNLKKFLEKISETKEKIKKEMTSAKLE